MWPQRAGRELAEKLGEFAPRAVVSPTLGGVIIGHETGRALSLPAMFVDIYRKRKEPKTSDSRGPRVGRCEPA